MTMSTSDDGHPLTCYSWQDKGVVYMLTTKHAHELATTTVDRRSGTEVNAVVAPVAAKEYGVGMDGVDRADQFRSSYCVQRRAQRWWMNLYW